jgi:hypothetical protein
VNDFCAEIKSLGIGTDIGSYKLAMLMFAVDLVLNVLSGWCLKRNVVINGQKTNVVHFRGRGTARSEVVFQCGTISLMYKEKYRYLGLVD